MKTTKITPINLLLMMCLGLILGIPSVVQAGRDHHYYGHSHYYDRHDRAYSKHHYYKKQRHKKRHAHRHGYRNNCGHTGIYNQPRGYYNNRHYNGYPQPQYYNGRSHSYNVNPGVYPAPVYGYPANVTLGINTGDASFMLRY